ncbi:MAG: SpoIIE family protein phosphatase [Streptosporangiaceae bacterium]
MSEHAPRLPKDRRQATASQYRFLAVPTVMAELQRALLSATLPVLPRATIGARYQAAGDSDAAGGGWFDAIPLVDGTVALAVGDVAGSGTSAVAAMGELRTVLGDQLATEPDLEVAVRRADALAQRKPELLAATMVLAQLSPEGGWLRYATCGHPPPLVIGQDGGSRFLASTGTGPLGTGSPPLASTATLQPEDCLLLYSIGLIQRPGSTAAEGMAELATTARATMSGRQRTQTGNHRSVRDPDMLCSRPVELLDRSGYADDVTTLAVQLMAEPVPALNILRPAQETSVLEIRRAFADWLAEIDAAAPDRNDLMLAVVEMVTNAVEHAYPPDQRGRVQLSAALAPDGTLECRVTDQGRWRQPDHAAGYRGHGLMVAGRVVDQLRVSINGPVGDEPAREPGTVVTLRHRLGRPASFGTDVSARDGRPSDVSFGLELDGGGPVPHATVSGHVAGGSADRLAQRLLAACRGGTLPIVVDLAGVSYLASSAIRAIYEVKELLSAHQQTLTIVAPPASAAAAMLDIVRLPHVESAVLS